MASFISAVDFVENGHAKHSFIFALFNYKTYVFLLILTVYKVS